MKATLSFDLPDQQEEWESYLKGPKYQSLIYELDQMTLRPIIKHGIVSEELAEAVKDLTGDELIIEVIDWVRKQLYDKANELDISVI